ncbi:hypothetical protein [Evansella clarkii]|uniref:hypothetical protein n=1 Tax=Evansella clarkii TaxID=79879 RepID=UPI0014300674|nr:hypothetical protein [Evansella clarkii]
MDDNKLREEIQLLIGQDIRARRKEKGWSIEKQMYKTGNLQSKFGQEVQGSNLEGFI